jgi:hypothetical protein
MSFGHGVHASGSCVQMDALRNADLDKVPRGADFDDETDFFILPTVTPVLGEAPQLP